MNDIKLFLTALVMIGLGLLVLYIGFFGPEGTSVFLVLIGIACLLGGLGLGGLLIWLYLREKKNEERPNVVNKQTDDEKY